MRGRHVRDARGTTAVQTMASCAECGHELSREELVEGLLLFGGDTVVLCVGSANAADMDTTASGWIGGDVYVG